MVFNTFIKCQVCGSITRIRLQVGWQEEHPIEVACAVRVHRVLWKMAGEAGRKSPDLQSDTFFSVRSICCSGIPGRNYGASGLDHDWCCNAAC